MLTLTGLIPSPEATACLPEAVARRLQLVPLARGRNGSGDWLQLACADLHQPELAERLARQLPSGMSTRCEAAPAHDIAQAIERCYATVWSAQQIRRQCREASSAQALMTQYPQIIVQLIDAVLLQACRQRASDIHLSPGASHMQLRFRIDGVLQTRDTLSMAVHGSVLVRLKILSGIDIAETRRPQDGQFSQLVDGQTVDFRVSCFPTRHGQNGVIRVLDRQCRHDTLSGLGLDLAQEVHLASLIRQPEGLLVVCGPTGAGKSNTLHALIRERDCQSLNIMTLEDPVELSMEGVCQSSIDETHAMGFAEGVRGLLRQDPDVLLIGEVRDAASCAMTLRAAMSGHQVLTSVHAGSALAGLARLRELGAGAGQLAENLVAIAGQRLLRRCCPHCRQSDHDCSFCRGTGYHGRQLIMELLVITPQISTLLASNATAGQLLACAREQGFVTLREQAQALVLQERTRTEEVERVLGGVVTMQQTPMDRETDKERVTHETAET